MFRLVKHRQIPNSGLPWEFYVRKNPDTHFFPTRGSNPELLGHSSYHHYQGSGKRVFSYQKNDEIMCRHTATSMNGGRGLSNVVRQGLYPPVGESLLKDKISNSKLWMCVHRTQSSHIEYLPVYQAATANSGRARSAAAAAGSAICAIDAGAARAPRARDLLPLLILLTKLSMMLVDRYFYWEIHLLICHQFFFSLLHVTTALQVLSGGSFWLKTKYFNYII